MNQIKTSKERFRLMASCYGFKDYPKEFWEKLAKKYDHQTKIAEHLEVGLWTVHHWMHFHNIKCNGKNGKAAYNRIPIPAKKELEKLYRTMNFLDISKHYGNVSNVTVKKWFIKLGIPIRERGENCKQTVIPKMVKTCQKMYGTKWFVNVPSLFPHTLHSKGELQVRDFLNSQGFHFQSTRSILPDGKELDGYDPNVRAAFEYNGSYWHTSQFKGKKDHWLKYKSCSNQGIRLFTIYENEWITNPVKWQAYLLAALNKHTTKYMARKLDIRTDSGKLYLPFLEQYHLQGKPKSYDFGVGLWTKDILGPELIGVMTFGRHHRQNTDSKEWVLNRLCWKAGVTVAGGTQRLWKAALDNVPSECDSIISWSDNRYSYGGVYERLGFTLDIEYSPSYDYIHKKTGVFRHKQSMKKKDIKARLGQTEEERAAELGFYRIFDCGKKRWTYKIS